MSLTHPLSEIAEQLEKAFFAIENLQLPGRSFPPQREDRVAHTWYPGVEILESRDNYTVIVDLAGINPDDVEIGVAEDLLVLRSREFQEPHEEMNRFEFEEEVDEANPKPEDYDFYGEFETEIPLPANVITDAVEADFTEGVLEIQLPKQEEARQKRFDQARME